MSLAIRRRLLPRIEELPAFPSDTELQPIVQMLADAAQLAERRPLGSLKALLRHVADELAPAVRERLADLATIELDARGRRAPPEPPASKTGAGAWLSLPEAAARIGIGPGTLLRRLEHPEHRRRLGYPQWDGRQWRFPSPALTPETAAACLALLPEHEPLEELLPDCCIRTGHSASPRDARSDEERKRLSRRAGVHVAPAP